MMPLMGSIGFFFQRVSYADDIEKVPDGWPPHMWLFATLLLGEKLVLAQIEDRRWWLVRKCQFSPLMLLETVACHARLAQRLP